MLTIATLIMVFIKFIAIWREKNIFLIISWKLNLILDRSNLRGYVEKRNPTCTTFPKNPSIPAIINIGNVIYENTINDFIAIFFSVRILYVDELMVSIV